jgi:hypothetical protein
VMVWRSQRSWRLFLSCWGIVAGSVGVFACSGSNEESNVGMSQEADGTSGAGTGGTGGTPGGGPSAFAGQATAGGANPSAGAGGSSNGGAPEVGGTSGGADADAGSNAAGARPGFHDCDDRKVVCRALAPECEGFAVPAIEGTCWGACVPIGECACQNQNECPDPNGTDEFVCLMSMGHCSPQL